MINDDFINAYLSLLIRQYYDKEKARAEITANAKAFSKIYDFYNKFISNFDIDTATGVNLDIIGKVVGVSRTVPKGIPNYYFGFYGNSYSKGFADKFAISDSAPFYDKFKPSYSALQLGDENYRFFIKAKISVNNASSFMVDDNRTSIQQIIQYLFNGDGYVTDNEDMTLTLYMPSSQLERIRLIDSLGLLPKPQGVRYKYIIRAVLGKTFGFSNNINAIGFGDKFNKKEGYFSEKVII